jgi:hypothetical protein
MNSDKEEVNNYLKGFLNLLNTIYNLIYTDKTCKPDIAVQMYNYHFAMKIDAFDSGVFAITYQKEFILKLEETNDFRKGVGKKTFQQRRTYYYKTWFNQISERIGKFTQIDINQKRDEILTDFYSWFKFYQISPIGNRLNNSGNTSVNLQTQQQLELEQQQQEKFQQSLMELNEQKEQRREQLQQKRYQQQEDKRSRLEQQNRNQQKKQQQESISVANRTSQQQYIADNFHCFGTDNSILARGFDISRHAYHRHFNQFIKIRQHDLDQLPTGGWYNDNIIDAIMLLQQLDENDHDIHLYPNILVERVQAHADFLQREEWDNKYVDIEFYEQVYGKMFSLDFDAFSTIRSITGNHWGFVGSFITHEFVEQDNTHIQHNIIYHIAVFDSLNCPQDNVEIYITQFNVFLTNLNNILNHDIVIKVIPYYYFDVPKQQNGNDCGLFALLYQKEFIDILKNTKQFREDINTGHEYLNRVNSFGQNEYIDAWFQTCYRNVNQERVSLYRNIFINDFKNWSLIYGININNTNIPNASTSVEQHNQEKQSKQQEETISEGNSTSQHTIPIG